MTMRASTMIDLSYKTYAWRCCAFRKGHVSNLIDDRPQRRFSAVGKMTGCDAKRLNNSRIC